MATFVFNGSESLALDDFDVSEDTIVVENVELEDVVSFERTGNTVTLTLSTGVALVLSGANVSQITDGNFDFSSTDIDPIVGVAGPDGTTGNLGFGSTGNDTLTSTSVGASIFGNQDNDTLSGGNFAEQRLYGGQGADSISAFGNNSLVYGGLGADTIDGSTAASGSTIFGGNGAADATDSGDQITGGAGADLIYGNGGNDSINSAGGEDTIYGGQGDDLVFGFGDASVVYGGVGADTIDGSTSADGVTIYGGNGFADAADLGDLLVGGSGDDSIFGNGGDDEIRGGGGADSVYGGQGDDAITGTYDAGSEIYGGLGDDVINVDGGADLAGSLIQIFGGNGTADPVDGEDVITFTTGFADAAIFGNGGDDTINFDGAGTGEVSAHGGAGDDVFNVTSTGANLVLTGGAGSDTFNFASNTSTADDSDIDTITDFNADEDQLVFAGTYDSVVQVQGTADTLFEAYNLRNADADTISIVTVTSGDAAGTYAVVFDNIVEITGYSGSIDDATFGLTA